MLTSFVKWKKEREARKRMEQRKRLSDCQMNATFFVVLDLFEREKKEQRDLC